MHSDGHFQKRGLLCLTHGFEVIRVIEEDVLSICRISWDIAISRLGIVRTLQFTPLDRRTWDITFAVELRMLYPAFRNAVVTQVCNDAVVTNTCIVWICSCTLHRRHSRRIITFTDRRLLRALPKYALPCVVLPAIRSRIILPCSIFMGANLHKISEL